MAVLTWQVTCCRVGLALLKTSEETLVALPFERLLTALNSRQFPAFSRPPAQLLRLALSFRVSRRLSISLADYQKQQALEEAQQAEQLALKQKQQQAKEAEQPKQTGSGGPAQKASSGQAGEGQRSGEQLKENGNTDGLTPPSVSARQPDDSWTGEEQALQNGDHARHSPIAQQQGAASQRAAAGGIPSSPAGSEATDAGAEQAPSSSSTLADGVHAQPTDGVPRGVESLPGANGNVAEPGAFDELQSDSPNVDQVNGLSQHLQGEAGAAAHAAGASTGLAEHAEPAGLDERADSFSSAHSEMAQPLGGADVDRADVDPAAALDAVASHPAGYYSEAVAAQRSDQPSLLPAAHGNKSVARQDSSRPGTMRNGAGSAAVSSKGQAKQSGSLLSFFGGASRKDQLGGSPQ